MSALPPEADIFSRTPIGCRTGLDLAPTSGAIARSDAAGFDATALEVRGMAPKHHPAPLSGGDRKALKKELSKSRAMTHIFAERSAEKRREVEALIREADNLACQSWNEKVWSDGDPIDPSPTIDRARPDKSQ